MIEDLLPIKLPPGIFANGTNYQKSGRWAEGNCIRFFQDTIQPIGGWVQRLTSSVTITGTIHAALSFLTQDGTPKLVVGTENGLYAIDAFNVVTDITPSLSGGNAAGDLNWQLSQYGPSIFAVNSLLGDDDLSVVNTFVWSGSGVATAAFTTAQGPRGGYSAFVTPERHLTILRGKDQTAHTARSGVDTVYSERRVYYASTETITDFTSTSTNTGGDFDLQTDGRLMVGTPARGQSLIWTDTDLWTMNFVGGQFVYGFTKAGDNCGIVSKRAFVQLDKGAYWMGRDKFFVYDGFVRSIPCEVTDAVFGDFNDNYAHKVWAVTNAKFNEITWFYPSLSGLHARADKFVTYNYEENHWTLGNLVRSAGVPRRHVQDVITEPKPVWFDGVKMYDHETGNERGSTPYLTSGPIELGNGDRLIRLQGILPDDLTVGDVQLRLYLSMAPDDAEVLVGPYALTPYTPLRHTARQIRIRLEEVNAVAWRVGKIRLAGRAAERRGVVAAETLDTAPFSLEIVPSEVTLSTSQHFTFDSIVRNAEGVVLDIEPDLWTSSNVPALPIDSTGTVTVQAAPEDVNIQAFITSPALSSNIAVVHVLSSARVPTTIVLPSTLSMQQLETDDIHARVYDQFGIEILDAPIDLWATTDATIAGITGTTLDHANVVSVTTDGTCSLHATISTGVITPVVSNACVVTVATTWVIHTFAGISTADFNVSAGSGNVEALIVAGGGGGAGTDGSGVGGGGGGGGGVIHLASQAVSVGAHVIAVGAGGSQGSYDHFTLLGNDGGSGQNSSALGSTAIGGGGGGFAFGTLTLGCNRGGYPGGSGGGGGTDGATPAQCYTAGSGTAGQGHNGGSGANLAARGGGGGGAGTAGVSGASTGNGGDGLSFTTANITGTPVYYGGGGGGGSTTIGLAGGSGGLGGGGGSPGGGAGTSGTASTGGGGGSGGGLTAGGGFGGGGIVIIKYRSNTGIVATGGTRVVLP